MTPADTIPGLPAAALVFPLLVGAALLVSGAAALLRTAGRRPAQRRGDATRALALALSRGRLDPAHPSSRIVQAGLQIVVGCLLLLAAGPAYTTAALIAAGLCALSLAAALRVFILGEEDTPAAPAPVAAASALLAFATAAAAQGILGFTGIPAYLLRFDPRDLTWAAALVGVLAACSLLQFARSAAPTPPATPPARRHA
ncbi:hypothetical protein C5C31_08290 [Rathayibacter rathayi]|uniref:hypothetical protein n=1 Tax=Rathayibacter rathayi TaxID=33887 RepID=UPI000CE7A73B|nr:hypothetical protein [Rathayibacter rathayi]PPG66276.1 hypothetical protein C5C02_11685 [Rathayibacter rathayi]PPG76883.1 hypothetical protein C5C23_06815 [Rathayibacter rathayi]PPG85528.1 hypothetical protein C5C47_13510 [Rathayibacter rathayi]PPG93766.1 hypothetical protein C5C00_13335 [Rathayibacter rathayi]PPH22921.1 hypothetical protein C5C31_08290 [Rathayibacter rathayi]